MRHRVDLQSRTDTADAYGGQTVTWTTESSNEPAAIWPVSAKEAIKAGQISMVQTMRVRVRYRSGLESDWRIKNGTKYYNITGIVDPDMSNRWLDLMCEEAES